MGQTIQFIETVTVIEPTVHEEFEWDLVNGITPTRKTHLILVMLAAIIIEHPRSAGGVWFPDRHVLVDKIIRPWYLN